jgi:hypothetical protein
MLLIDLSAVCCAKPMTLYYEGATPSIKEVRSVLFRDIMDYANLFGKDFGRVVVCVDSRPYWRTEVQPSYKQNRAKAKQQSAIDWDAFGADIQQMTQDLKDVSNYVVIDIQGAEADDIIAVLAKHADSNGEKTCLVSSDKDMLQLQLRHKTVFQFSPNRNKLLTLENTEYDLLPHFLKGDVSDGIPNVFSPDNFFMIEGDKPRQKSITKGIVADVREIENDDEALLKYFGEETFKRFEQNKQLIDTTYIPEELANRILKAHEEGCKLDRLCGLSGLISAFDAEEDCEEEPQEVVKI